MTALIPADQLAIGLQLPVQAQSKVFAEHWEADAGVEEITAIATAADQLGFFYLGVCDHIAVPRQRAATMGTTWYDTMTTLGYLAGITFSIRLLTHVYVASLRHPLQAAKSLATLDVVSRGRAIFGVGAGHVAEEFALTGAEFPRRGVLLDDAIDIQLYFRRAKQLEITWGGPALLEEAIAAAELDGERGWVSIDAGV